MKDLHLYISKRKISKLVTQAASGLVTEKQKLIKEFQEANEDRERNEEMELWDLLSNDGLDS